MEPKAFHDLHFVPLDRVRLVTESLRAQPSSPDVRHFQIPVDTQSTFRDCGYPALPTASSRFLAFDAR